jgi:hypothetical protein
MPQIGEREQLLSSEEIRMFFFNGKTHKNTFLVHLPTDQSVDISGAQYLHPGFFSVQDVLVGSTQLLVPAETPRQTFTYFVVYTRPLVDGWCGISWILERM